ncbi:synaptonemal complex central element protein 1 isoform X2 [Puntigrus tetrazona]|uniref:synaptonemal complex central element protein 1 isoform X2 n=1 Tax=Puntigrus tetrazona TaxID=1606681 RepID=UPI001C892DC1|nr:synaptonemal complex central element protein 1 isoform X2 [Puntigrus tetrazona]
MGLNAFVFLKKKKTIGSRSEPKPAELLLKLRKLQRAKMHFEDEVKEMILLRRSRNKEEDAVTAEALQLEAMLNQKEELSRSLQLKYEDLQLEAQMMKFENQLQQLMEQHKNLSNIFTPQRLPAEIQSAEYTTEQLLKAEQQKLEQLTKLLDGLSHTQNAEVHMETCEKAP